MDLNDAIHGRRAVRAYRTEPVDEDVLKGLIDAAIWAPSAVNQQPWSFVIVRDQRLLDCISREAKAHMLTTLSAESPRHFRDHLSDPDFHIFYHAPVLVLISAVSAGPWTVEDCALAAQNLMLAAYAAGLGSCWIGFAQSFLGTAAGRDALSLPSTHVPVAPIIVGHPQAPAAPVPRQRPDIRWIG
jgi:nitroreductase